MRSIWAVAKNTFTTAVRMKTAIIFLLLLVILLPVMSVIMTGDGTTKGKAQSFVSYGLSLTTFLLSLLTIIISTHTLTNDIKRKQLFMVITKPIRRFELLCGKFLGVVMLDVIGLIVFASVIYALTLQIPRITKASDNELLELNNQFFTARASLPMTVDMVLIETEAAKAYEEMKEADHLPEGKTKKQVLNELINQKELQSRAAGPGTELVWEFENINTKSLAPGQNIFVRFKYNVSQTPPDKKILGSWAVGDYRQIKHGSQKLKTPVYQLTRRDVITTIHEIEIPADAVAPDGYLAVVFYNEPANNTTIIFPTEDGLSVLYKAGTFTNNFIKSVILILARLVFLTALGIAVSTWLSFPVAILVCLSVFFTGLMHSFIIESFSYLSGPMTIFYAFTIKPIIWLLPKFDGELNVTRYMVSSEILRVFFLISVVGVLMAKALIVSLLGVFIFSRREIAKITV